MHRYNKNSLEPTKEMITITRRSNPNLLRALQQVLVEPNLKQNYHKKYYIMHVPKTKH